MSSEAGDSGGRPSLYSEELAEEICGRLAVGESLRAICLADDMPSMRSVMRWLDKSAEFRQQYARAREVQAEYLIDELVEIADDGTNDYMQKRDAEEKIIGWRENGEFLQRSRLRVDARKWAISKLAPKKYGDKVSLEHEGPNGGPMTTAAITLPSDPVEAARAYWQFVNGGTGEE